MATDGQIFTFAGRVFTSDGSLAWSFPDRLYSNGSLNPIPLSGETLPIDIDNDSSPEVAYFDELRSSEGDLIFAMEIAHEHGHSLNRTYFSFGNFDADENQEIVVNAYYSGSRYRIILIDDDGSKIWHIDTSEEGAISVIDIDGDGDNEIYHASTQTLYNHIGHAVWDNGINDKFSSASFVDFNQDGIIDILQYRMGNLQILDGNSGVLLGTQEVGNSVLPQLPPLFVDTDNRDGGELITAGRSTLNLYKGRKQWAETSVNQKFYWSTLSSLFVFAGFSKPFSVPWFKVAKGKFIYH